MPHLVVCSLFDLQETAHAHGAREMISLIDARNRVDRPATVHPDRHLFVNLNDITARVEGLQAPEEDHIRTLLDFARSWDRSAPLLIHCWMGVSRSTAAAYITAMALNTEFDEAGLAVELRRRSPSATPNPRMIALADRLLERDGRMVRAIKQIGRGAEASHGAPFVLPLEFA